MACHFDPDVFCASRSLGFAFPVDVVASLLRPLCASLRICVVAVSWSADLEASSWSWSQLADGSTSCNWDNTRAASPLEILRSINRLQTQVKRGGLAGFEVSRSCKSISSGFVLIPRKASISMSSPVVA